MVAVRPSTAARTWSAHMQKTGDIYLASEKESSVHLSAPGRWLARLFLCAADADACGTHPDLRELLIELAAEVALNRGRAAGDSIALQCGRRSAAARAGAPMMVRPARIWSGNISDLLVKLELFEPGDRPSGQVQVTHQQPS